jgi:hypothetical protein
MCAWRICFYYGLFNYAFSSSGFIPSNAYMINEWGNVTYLEDSECHFSSTVHSFLSFQVEFQFPAFRIFLSLVCKFSAPKKKCKGEFCSTVFLATLLSWKPVMQWDSNSWYENCWSCSLLVSLWYMLQDRENAGTLNYIIRFGGSF